MCIKHTKIKSKLECPHLKTVHAQFVIETLIVKIMPLYIGMHNGTRNADICVHKKTGVFPAQV